MQYSSRRAAASPCGMCCCYKDVQYAIHDGYCKSFLLFIRVNFCAAVNKEYCKLFSSQNRT